MKNIITILLLTFVGIIPGFAQKVSVEAMIDSTAILVGEQTGLHLGATIKDGQKVQFPVLQSRTYLIPGVEIVEILPQDTQRLDDDFIKVSAHYVLTSFDDTLYYLPPMKVKVDNKEYESKNLALKVLTIDVDTLHPNQFFPPKDVQDNPFNWSEWSSLIWLSALALLLYGLIILMYIRLKSKKPIVFKVRIVKRVPPHQKALSSIEEIKTHTTTVTAEDSKRYYTQLTDTLRHYMMERFGFNAMEMTSSEIIGRLRQEKDQQKIEELTMLFETADLVKFAKHSTGVSENDHNLISAIDFINTTKQENVPTEEKIQPTVTEQDRQTIRARISLKWAIGIFGVVASAVVVYVVWQLIILLA